MLDFSTYCVTVAIVLSVCGFLPSGLSVHKDIDPTSKRTLASQLSMFQVGLGKFEGDSDNPRHDSKKQVVNIERLSTDYRLGHYFEFCKLSMVCSCTTVSFPRKQQYSSMNERGDYNKNIAAASGLKAVKQTMPVYLAANWVDSFYRQHAFIASRAPLEGSETDSDVLNFWRMVWHNHVYVIVMLAPKNEYHKSGQMAQYWPDELYETKNVDGRYTVTSLSIDNCAKGGYVCSALNLTRMDGKHRVVTHCLFSEWPDMKVPTITEQLLAFRRHIKKLASAPKKAKGSDIYALIEGSDTPILVHCFAGLGRTGTFIALDVLIERMDSESGHPVDVAGVVNRLRLRRPRSILCEAQYNFLVTALQIHKCRGDRMVC